MKTTHKAAEAESRFKKLSGGDVPTLDAEPSRHKQEVIMSQMNKPLDGTKTHPETVARHGPVAYQRSLCDADTLRRIDERDRNPNRPSDARIYDVLSGEAMWTEQEEAAIAADEVLRERVRGMRDAIEGLPMEDEPALPPVVVTATPSPARVQSWRRPKVWFTIAASLLICASAVTLTVRFSRNTNNPEVVAKEWWEEDGVRSKGERIHDRLYPKLRGNATNGNDAIDDHSLDDTLVLKVGPATEGDDPRFTIEVDGPVGVPPSPLVGVVFLDGKGRRLETVFLLIEPQDGAKFWSGKAEDLSVKELSRFLYAPALKRLYDEYRANYVPRDRLTAGDLRGLEAARERDKANSDRVKVWDDLIRGLPSATSK